MFMSGVLFKKTYVLSLLSDVIPTLIFYSYIYIYIYIYIYSIIDYSYIFDNRLFMCEV